MSDRLRLTEIRAAILRNLDDQWRTPSEITDAFHAAGHRFGGGRGWYMVALTLERLANDGVIEIRVRGNRRTFRRVA